MKTLRDRLRRQLLRAVDFRERGTCGRAVIVLAGARWPMAAPLRYLSYSDPGERFSTFIDLWRVQTGKVATVTLQIPADSWCSSGASCG